MVNFFLTRIDSRFGKGAYFSPGGYDPLLAPLSGYGERIEPFEASFAPRTRQ
jgi:hypothetical protein